MIIFGVNIVLVGWFFVFDSDSVFFFIFIGLVLVFFFLSEDLLSFYLLFMFILNIFI